MAKDQDMHVSVANCLVENFSSTTKKRQEPAVALITVSCNSFSRFI